MPSLLEMPLYEFACANSGSVRLRNSLEGAAAAGLLPFGTVMDYLASPAPIETMLRDVRNFGRGTGAELDRMIRNLSSTVKPDDMVMDAPVPAEIEGELITLQSGISTVRSLLDTLPTSPRLARVLQSHVGDLAAFAAIRDRSDVVSQVIRIEKAGAGTADELYRQMRLAVSKHLRQSGRTAAMHDALLHNLFGPEPGPSWRVESADDRAAAAMDEMVRTLLGDMECAAVFDDAVVNARLRGLVTAKGVGNRGFADALLGRQRFNWDLSRVANVGRKTIAEFWDLLWRRFAVVVANAGIEDLAALAAHLQVEPASLVPHPEDMAEHGPLIGAADSGSDRVTIPRELDDLLEFLLRRIRAQDAPIIRRRFGLGGMPGETLEEIGQTMSITRERVRQIEKRGLGDLRVLARRVDLRGAVDAQFTRAWDALADGDDLVTDIEFATFSKTVPAQVQLALEILRIGLSDWLSTVSHRYPHGWLAPHRDREPVEAALEAIGLMPSELPLPRSLAELGLPGSRLDMEAAILVGRGMRILHGYLVSGRVGTRSRRALVAHSLLARAGRPMTLGDLQREYHRAASADQCSTRDLAIVMSDAPHLFLEVSEGRWAAVGEGGETPAGGRRAEIDAVEEGSAEGDLTVAAAIRDELDRTGPQSQSVLLDNAARFLPRGRSRNSVQPTLITRPDMFARLLPGVYSLWDQVPGRDQILTGAVPYLLDEQQARVFAMARRASEPWGSFPLWVPEAEYRLCRWAIREASAEVRRSLLATATVDVWPIEPSERAEWRAICARDGRYDLVGTIRPAVFTTRPELDRILAALIDLETTGRTSWMTLNRVDGRQVSSRFGCGLLAVLVLTGAVLTPDQSQESAWQLAHGISRRETVELRSILSAELHATGRLEWTSMAGRMIAERLLESEGAAPPWIPFHRYSALFRSIGEEIPDVREITPEIVGEAGHALLAERRMADLLSWLDDQ